MWHWLHQRGSDFWGGIIINTGATTDPWSGEENDYASQKLVVEKRSPLPIRRSWFVRSSEILGDN